MLLSIVIPVYNIDKALLERSIQSVLSTGEENIEVVVVDDGSDEGNSAGYNEVCMKSQAVSYVRKENGGPSSARNYGVEKASGDYILFLDADDYLTPICIPQAISTVERTKADIVMGYVYKDLYGRSGLLYSQGDSGFTVIKNDNNKAKLLNHLLGYRLQSLVREDGYLSDGPWARVFKRELFDDNKFDLIPRWNEDTLWNIGLIKSADKIAVCKNVWYVYDVRMGSVTQGLNGLPNSHENLYSIIVPVYNTPEPVLQRCFDSIRNQIYRLFECIFVDDGSEMGCAEFIDKLCTKDDRFKAVHISHSGNSYGRNKGIECSNGDYVTFVDSDDIVSPAMLAQADLEIRKSHPDVVLGLVRGVFGESIDKDFDYGTDNSRCIHIRGKGGVGRVVDQILGYLHSDLCFPEGYISGGPIARFIRMDIAKKCKFPDGDLLTEDVIWNCAMLSVVESMVVVPNIWYVYFKYDGSKSRKYYEDGKEKFVRQVRAYYKACKKYWPENEKGLYIKLWQEITMYFRIYLSHPLNRNSWRKRYSEYKRIFSMREYRESVNRIDFSYENNRLKRLAKKIVLYMIRKRLYLPTWCIWKWSGKRSL